MYNSTKYFTAFHNFFLAFVREIGACVGNGSLQPVVAAWLIDSTHSTPLPHSINGKSGSCTI